MFSNYYKQFRVFIGTIGVLLPLLLILFSGIFSGNKYWIQPSISHYYYSVMHFLFGFVLILLGFFLILYKGNNKVKYEDLISTISGVLAFLIVIFPTEIEGFVGETPFITIVDWKPWYKYIHFSAAFGLFSSFAVFCLVFFQKSDNDFLNTEEQIKKKRRNKLYKTCGWIIVFSILLMGLFSLEKLENFVNKNFKNYMFYFECVAMWAFGIAWLTKGADLFKNSTYKIFSKLR